MIGAWMLEFGAPRPTAAVIATMDRTATIAADTADPFADRKSARTGDRSDRLPTAAGSTAAARSDNSNSFAACARIHGPASLPPPGRKTQLRVAPAFAHTRATPGSRANIRSASRSLRETA